MWRWAYKVEDMEEERGEVRMGSEGSQDYFQLERR
jgi:hypothetical protein